AAIGVSGLAAIGAEAPALERGAAIEAFTLAGGAAFGALDGAGDETRIGEIAGCVQFPAHALSFKGRLQAFAPRCDGPFASASPSTRARNPSSVRATAAGERRGAAAGEHF